MFEEIVVFGLLPMLSICLLILWAIRPMLEIVPEENRLVIYRFGVFNRVAGPGRVWVNRRIEKVERTLNVRDEPRYVELNGLYAYDIPLGYTLSIWYKLDPLAAAAGDQHILRKLVQFSNEECDENIRVRIHDLFVKHISEFLSTYQLPSKPTVLDKLVPFAPGQPACEQILNKVRQELPDVLRSFGVQWNPSQPIAIKNFHLSSGIVKLLDRDRVLANFQQRIPNCDPDLLAQTTIALEGIISPAMRKVVLNQSGGNFMPGLETSLDDDFNIRTMNGSGYGNGNGSYHPEPVAFHRNTPYERQQSLMKN